VSPVHRYEPTCGGVQSATASLACTRRWETLTFSNL
jgi:hypothetical protein